ncbi:MAG: hypothetical protein J6K42_00975 [Clostridia bacterium]|nr:hypothetical protein [Clostridia bacterium]
MKIKINFFILVILGLMLIPNIAKSYTIFVEDIQAKKGEEFTINISVDEETPLANGQIKFDASKVEFIKSSQQCMNTRVTEDGNLAWVYVNLEEGVKNFEFTFKIKEKGASEMKLENLAFVDIKGNEYSENKINGNKVIKINSEEIKKTYKFWAILVIAIIFVIIAIVFIKNIRKK